VVLLSIVFADVNIVKVFRCSMLSCAVMNFWKMLYIGILFQEIFGIIVCS